MRTKCPPMDLDRVEGLVKGLTAALRNRRIYQPGHARAQSALKHFLTSLRDALHDQDALRVTVVDGYLTHEGVPLGSGVGMPAQIARILTERGGGGLIFDGDFTEESVTRLLDWMGEREPLHEQNAYAGIQILPKSARDTADAGGAQLPAPEFETSTQIHSTAATVIEHAMEDMRAHRKIDFKEIVELTRWTAAAAFSQGAQLVAPTHTVHHDEYTFCHSVNVFLIASTLLQRFARDPKELAIFSQAALLHDIGKSRIPQEILQKQSRLTDEEFALIKKHPEYGAETLQRSKYTDPLAIEVAFCHHMRDNGLGYPNPTLPIKPGPVANIVQVTDMFEALTANRPYHKGLSAGQAIEKILTTPGMAGKRSAIMLLLERLTSSPPGSEVKLDSGERALVLESWPEAPHQPLVRVFLDADGNRLAEPYEVDLRDAGPDARPIVEVFLKPNSEAVEAVVPCLGAAPMPL